MTENMDMQQKKRAYDIEVHQNGLLDYYQKANIDVRKKMK